MKKNTLELEIQSSFYSSYRDNRVSIYKRQANMHYDSYFMHCKAIAREAKNMLLENNIEYNSLSCTMFPRDGLCIRLDFNDEYIPYVIPVEVFFNKVKTQEDIKLYAI